jgi:protein involved in polysaccharide export with SLBB domain
MSTRNFAFLSLGLGICMFVAGCASRPSESVRADLSPLKPKERISIDFHSRTCILCFGPPSFEIDEQGFVRFSSSVTVRVAGLTPVEAASRIRAAFWPRYFSDLEVEVARPQPHHAVTSR